MRPFEASLVVALLLLGVLIFAGMAKPLKQLLLYLCVLVLGIHLWREGAHWQMLPAYIGLLLAIPFAFATPQHDGDLKLPLAKLSAVFIMLLCLGSVAFSVALPMFSLPKPTGQYAVGTRILYLEDKNRHEPSLPDPAARRKVVVQVWYPSEASQNKLAVYRKLKESDLISTYQSVIRTNSREDAAVKVAGSPFPIILLGHGLGGRRGALTYLAEDLASHGYVVASLDYPYVAARVEWRDGQIIRGTKQFRIIYPDGYTAAEMKSEWDQEVALAAADQTFVLNTLTQENNDPQSSWYHRLNTDLAGSIGHSFGGAAAQYASSRDTRIRSAINIDGWSLGGLDPDSSKPVMYIYGDLDSMRFDDPALTKPPRNAVEQLSWTDFAVIQQALKQHGGYVINITDTNHLDFTDKALITSIPRLRRRSGLSPIKPEEIFSIVRSYTLAFFNATMLGTQSSLLDPQTKSPFSEVTLQRWQTPLQEESGTATKGH